MGASMRHERVVGVLPVVIGFAMLFAFPIIWAVECSVRADQDRAKARELLASLQSATTDERRHEILGTLSMLGLRIDDQLVEFATDDSRSATARGDVISMIALRQPAGTRALSAVIDLWRHAEEDPAVRVSSLRASLQHGSAVCADPLAVRTVAELGQSQGLGGTGLYLPGFDSVSRMLASCLQPTPEIIERLFEAITHEASSEFAARALLRFDSGSLRALPSLAPVMAQLRARTEDSDSRVQAAARRSLEVIQALSLR